MVGALMPRLPNLDRRWWAAGVVLVAVIIAMILSETVFKESSEECRPVRALLEFNTEQTKLVNDKGDDASVADYERWADGLAERAGQVSDPDLASRSVRVADLAGQFAAGLPTLRAQTNVPAGSGQEAPKVAYEMAALNTAISEEIKQLTEACPG